jgi:cytidylate kinase
MRDNLIISISREYGSGGREIAETLAKELEIAYWDKMLIKRIAQESGLSGDIVEAHDEKPINRFLFNPNRFLSGTDTTLPITKEIYQTEISLLRKIADEGPCVVVGRRADVVLDENPGLIKVFVSAPLQSRIARVMDRNNLEEAPAKNLVAKTDKARANYQRDFTSRIWGAANSYDLCINSESLAVKEAVSVIVQYLNVTQKGCR